jgi:hypothetical protein
VTTPLAPGAPEAGPNPGTETAPGAPETAPQQQNNPAPPQQLGKPNQQGQPKAPGAPDKQPSNEPAKTDGEDPQDVSSLPDWAQKLIKKTRAEAADTRTNAKKQAAEEAKQQLTTEIAKALGLNPDDEPTVDSLTAELQELRQANEQLSAQQTENFYRDVVRTQAGALNADAEVLLDSAGFRNAVQDELDDDFTDEQLATAVKKVAAEYAKQPRFQKSAAPARSGGEITGGPPPATKQRAKSLNEAVRRQYVGG